MSSSCACFLQAVLRSRMFAIALYFVATGAAASALPQIAVPMQPTEGEAELVRSIEESIEGSLGPRTKGEVIFLKLKGSFEFGLPDGGSLRSPDEEVISPAGLYLMLKACERRKPAAVVLEISSPGGLVDVKHVLLDLIAEAGTGLRGMRIVAWPQSDCYSAAALLALACNDIVVRPTTKLGAATRVVAGGEAAEAPKTAGELKAASVEKTRDRRAYTGAKRDERLINAMRDPAAMLWYHPEHGFVDSLPVGDGWQALDTSTDEPLTLDANQMVETKIALASMASSEAEVCRALGLAEPVRRHRIDLRALASDGRAPYSKAMGHWREWLRSNRDVIDEFAGKVYGELADLEKLRQKVQDVADSGQTISYDLQSKLTLLVDGTGQLPMSDVNGIRRLAQFGGAAWADEWAETCRKMKLHAVKAGKYIRPLGPNADDRLGGVPESIETLINELKAMEGALAGFLAQPVQGPNWLWKLVLPEP
jgi:hypothetical protein